MGGRHGEINGGRFGEEAEGEKGVSAKTMAISISLWQRKKSGGVMAMFSNNLIRRWQQ
jgi:hypothetical protein